LHISKRSSSKVAHNQWSSLSTADSLDTIDLHCVKTNAQNCSVYWQKLSEKLAVTGTSKSASISAQHRLEVGELSQIVISTDGTLFVSDILKPQILKLQRSVINLDDPQKEYVFADAADEQLYVFNSLGVHLSTMNAITGKPVFTFQYESNGASNQIAAFAKLAGVTDASGFRVTIQRNGGKVTALESSNGQNIQTQFDNRNRLQSIHRASGLRTQYQYSNLGLLTSRLDSDSLSVHYDYDSFGRLTSIVQPTGSIDMIQYSIDTFGKLSVRFSHLTANLDEAVRSRLMIISNHQEQIQAQNSVRLIQLQTNAKLLTQGTGKEKQGLIVASALHPLLLAYLPSYAQLNQLPSLLYRLQHETHNKSKIQVKGGSVRWSYELRWKNSAYSSSDSHPLQQLARMSAVERVLYVNGSRFLSIEYDHSANREILYNSTRRPFLMIQYDNYSRPVQWLHTESRLPLNLMYDSVGRLIGWQQGQRVSESYLYTANDRLSEIKYPDGSAIRYNEENTEAGGRTRLVILRSGKSFAYRYDTTGGLYEIDAGEGIKHQLRLQALLGAYKLVYRAPGFHTTDGADVESGLVVMFDEKRRPLLVRLAGGNDKIVFRYDSPNAKQPNQVLFGGGKITRHIGASGQLHWESSVNQAFDSDRLIVLRTVNTFKSASSPSEIRLEVQTNEWTPSIRIAVDYDDWRRKVALRVSCVTPLAGSGESSYPVDCLFEPLDYAYSEHSGRLNRIGRFVLQQLHELGRPHNESRWSDSYATLSRQFDSSSLQARQVSLQLGDRQAHRASYSYDQSGRLTHVRRLLRLTSATVAGQVRLSTVNFTYDTDGQLTQVHADREHWRFGYDRSGNLQRIQYGASVISLRIDSQAQRVTAFGDTDYVYDTHGRLVRRGVHERFTYNSLGQLVHVQREQLEGPSFVEFAYDARGRLSWRRDSAGNRTMFVYADVERPHLCTHSLHWHSDLSDRSAVSPMLAITYAYDEHGLLIALHRSDTRLPFYVICDQVGSPTHVFHEGRLVKELHRSPFGHVLRDSAPSFVLVFGFQGALADPLLSIVFLQAPFVYDTLIGQYFQPNFGQALHSGLSQPQLLSVYRFARNDPINSAFVGAPLHEQQLDLNRWIQHQGIDLSVLDLQMRMIRSVDQFSFDSSTESATNGGQSLAFSRPTHSERWPHYAYGQSAGFHSFDALFDYCLLGVHVPHVAPISASDVYATQLIKNFGRISFVQRPQVTNRTSFTTLFLEFLN
jgi:YD repeat-containing protein